MTIATLNILQQSSLQAHNRDSDLHARGSMRLSMGAREFMFYDRFFDRRRIRASCAAQRDEDALCLTHRVMHSHSRRFRHRNFFRCDETEVE